MFIKFFIVIFKGKAIKKHYQKKSWQKKCIKEIKGCDYQGVCFITMLLADFLERSLPTYSH